METNSSQEDEEIDSQKREKAMEELRNYLEKLVAQKPDEEFLDLSNQ